MNVQQFWDQVTVTDGCWLWTGGKTTAGYGSVNLDGTNEYAHRLSYRLIHLAEVPEGLELDHLCGVRNCVSPEHLEPVTHAENIRRALAYGGPNRSECPRGHDVTDGSPTIYIDKNGWRHCRECKHEKQRERRAAARS